MSTPRVVVLVTMNSKGKEGQYICDVLKSAGVDTWIMDVSLKSHDVKGADVTGGEIAKAAGTSWEGLGEMGRGEAGEAMIAGGRKIIMDKFEAGEVAGIIGLGGANGTSLSCNIMRVLPFLVPKTMISAVAATAAVQWYVAESDIAMYPSIGDVSLNRITKAVMESASLGLAAAAKNWAAKQKNKQDNPPLIAVSSFGGTAKCVDRVTEQLEAKGYEVILFMASGIGGRALERLAKDGELSGVIDITTHEMTDLVVDGVYSAGEERLRNAGRQGLPQVVVPGATDHANFWTGQVPEKYKSREFYQYNAQNLLMRTNAEEFDKLGQAFADRLNVARGPVKVMIPLEGYSEHTKRTTHDLDGKDVGPWKQPDADHIFIESLRRAWKDGDITELPMHINDAQFADALVEEFLKMAEKT